MMHLRSGVRARTVAALALLLGASALAGPARAQFLGGWDQGGWYQDRGSNGFARQQVRRSLMGQGYRILFPMRQNGDVFVADVMDRSMRRQRLVVSASDARILQRIAIDDGRGEYQGQAPRRDFYASRGYGYGDPQTDEPTFREPERRQVRPDEPMERAEPRRASAPPLKYVKPPADDADEAPARPAPGIVAVPRPLPKAPVVRAPSTPTVPPPVARTGAGSQAPATRPADPLAIPGGREARAVRSVAPGITGAPPEAKRDPSNVPVAPLD